MILLVLNTFWLHGTIAQLRRKKKKKVKKQKIEEKEEKENEY